jgi:hypothetical protein
MSEKSLIAALRKDYESLPSEERIEKIKELVAESEDNRKFLKKFFPEFYAEAFLSRSRVAARKWESGSRGVLAVKHR